MPPRKKVKTNSGAPARAGRNTRASIKATTDASNGQPPVAAPVVVKMRRGCLKDIPNIAVELQLQIFGHLHPQDLFNLSRTCKMFHNWFLHRSNERLWEAALENADGLPERPPWLSVPAFVHLLYSTHCHNCGCANIRKIIWAWWARYCSNCLPKVSCTVSYAKRKFAADQTLSRYTTYYSSLLRGIPAPNQSQLSQSRRRYNGYYGYDDSESTEWLLKRHVDDLMERWSSLPEPRDTVTWNNFYAQRRKEIVVQNQYAHQCKQWHDALEEERKDELRSGREERFDAVVKKLKETGWEKDLEFLGKDGLEKLSRQPVVRRSTQLTDKEWQKVQEALHTFLNEARSERLAVERKVVIKDRFAELDAAVVAHCVTIPRNATMDCRPVAFDLAYMKKLEPLANAPSSKTVTRDTFARIVPKLVEAWHAEQRKSLESLLRPFIPSVPRGVDILDLAIAVFYKSSASVHRIRYPYILTNSSFRYDYDSRPDPDHYAAPAAPRRYSIPYSLESLDPKRVEGGIKWMRDIVTELGLNPATATLADLEQCEARLRCLKCAEARKGNVVFAWEAAFEHTAENDTTDAPNRSPRSSHDRWSRVDKKDMGSVRTLEAAAHVLSPDRDCWWSCALCVDRDEFGGEDSDVRKHLVVAHNVEDAERAIDDGTIYWSLRNFESRKPPVTLPRGASAR